METPVAVILFNRPDATGKVMQAIARARPSQLFLIADGPRKSHPEDVARCAAAREAAERQIDWPCKVLRNYSETNLGCGWRPASGISWVFEHVDRAIILEDDCVPHLSFFRFCDELLDLYRDDERVMHIAGSTYRRERLPVPYSYDFSCFNGAWGWATWRRAWQHFDLSLKTWPLLRDTPWLDGILENEQAVRYWASEFERAYESNGYVSYWDHQWTYACWANSGLSIVPRQNLVSNVGCGKDATHTFDENDPTANLPVEEMEFPLEHPILVLQNRDFDRRKLRETILPRLEQAPKRRPRSIARRYLNRLHRGLNRRLGLIRAQWGEKSRARV